MADLTSAEARLLILEAVVAALVAQLPKPSLEETVGLLTYLSGMAEEAEDAAGPVGQEQLEYVRQWADRMLDRVMVSRKPSRPARVTPDEAMALRYPGAGNEGWPQLRNGGERAMPGQPPTSLTIERR